MYIVFLPHQDPDSQGYKATELGCLIITHLFYPLLHIQQSQNESTNTLINMVTGKILKIFLCMFFPFFPILENKVIRL